MRLLSKFKRLTDGAPEVFTVMVAVIALADRAFGRPSNLSHEDYLKNSLRLVVVVSYCMTSGYEYSLAPRLRHFRALASRAFFLGTFITLKVRQKLALRAIF
jgi:hypothetical protein